ncbi:hypothetical protein RRG08_052819 [Elysia crispata]|uniref:Uncharacterized protein n=1 Tax=Elysia crispata TaxID=231223 RepID=A0AAE1B7L0_9GAST|nr:hypothetical protein RRG08_052819 [Elysia crispata]
MIDPQGNISLASSPTPKVKTLQRGLAGVTGSTVCQKNLCAMFSRLNRLIDLIEKQRCLNLKVTSSQIIGRVFKPLDHLWIIIVPVKYQSHEIDRRRAGLGPERTSDLLPTVTSLLEAVHQIFGSSRLFVPRWLDVAVT